MKLKIAAGIAMVSAISCMPHANAQKFLDLLKDYLGSNTVLTQSQATIKTNINTRQAQLESEIAAGAASGQLTAQEEADLRNKLNNIAALEGQYLSDGNFSNPEVQSMLTQLSDFSSIMQAYLSNATTTGAGTYNSGWFKRYGWGNHAGMPNNQAQFQANIDTKQAQIDASIQHGVSSGLLTWNESTNLKVQLDKIANDEARFLSDGKLSYREVQELIQPLESLEAKVNQELADGQRRAPQRKAWGRGGHGHRAGGRFIDYHQSLLRQRIQNGLSTGKLTHSEANRLFQEEQRLNSLEAQMRYSGRRLSYSEERRLIAELDQLSRKINKELNDKQVQ